MFLCASYTRDEFIENQILICVAVRINITEEDIFHCYDCYAAVVNLTINTGVHINILKILTKFHKYYSSVKGIVVRSASIGIKDHETPIQQLNISRSREIWLTLYVSHWLFCHYYLAKLYLSVITFSPKKKLGKAYKVNFPI